MKHPNLKRTFVASLFVAAIFLGACTGKRDLVLVKNGVSEVPVVVAPDASEATRQAAVELADYIEKISGARPDVVQGSGSVQEKAIWVGIQPSVAELFPHQDLDFQFHEEILLMCNGRHLLIAGRDKMRGGVQTEFGTANAVYTFIQDHLDVRWLWPGPLGEDIIQKKTITIPLLEFRYHPQFRQRSVYRSFVDSKAKDWARFQRIYFDSFKPSGGHGFGDWHDKYYKEHPDYFALQPDGTRGTYPSSKHMKLCESNPHVWDQWLKNAEQRLMEDPTVNVVSAMPNDGHSSGICMCEDCRAWDNPNARKWIYGYKNGERVEHVAMTDRYVKFWNILARKLKERFPDRDVYVSTFAYGPSTPAPLEEELEDNLVVGYVGKFPLICDVDPFDSQYPRQGRIEQKEEFKEWANKAPMMMFRPNLWYWGGGLWGLPEVAMKKTMEDLRFVADNGCRGFFVDHTRGHWATQGPLYYLMAQMSWNPYLDGEALLKEYYRRGFGKAAEEIEGYWNHLEEANRRLVELPDFNPRPMHSPGLVKSLPGIYNKAFFSDAEKFLKQARTKLEGEPEIYMKRVDFLEAGLEFSDLLIHAIELMEDVRESGGKDKVAVEKATGIWKEIDNHCEQNKPYAINLSLNPESRFRAAVIDYLGPPSEEFRKAAGLLEIQ